MAPLSLVATAALVFADQNRTLPPPVRVKAMLALVGIIVLGFGLAAMILLGGLAVKRRARHRSGPSSARDESWYQKPLDPGPTAEGAPSDDHDE